MNDWSDSFYLFIYGAVLLLSVLGLSFTAIMPGSDRWSKRFFRLYFLILMLSMLSGVTEGILHIFFNESSIVFFAF